MKVEGIKVAGVDLRIPPAPPYEPPGLGRLRKIALIGTAGTVRYAPFHDPSWEIWAHASAGLLCPRVDRFFDLHPKHVWSKSKAWRKDYPRWLLTLPVPIYMQQHYTAVPQSIRYPKERILAEFRRYFSSQAAWMIALALTEGVTHLGFFGIHYAAKDERDGQRSGCEYWMGVAEGKGVQLVFPDGCPLLSEPRLMYGYENYDKHGKPIKTPVAPKFDPSKLTAIDMNSSAPRPPLMALRSGEPPRWEHSGHQFHF